MRCPGIEVYLGHQLACPTLSVKPASDGCLPNKQSGPRQKNEASGETDLGLNLGLEKVGENAQVL